MDGCAFVGHRQEGKTGSMFRDSPCGKDPTAVDLFSYPWSVRKCSLRPWNLLLGKSLRRLFPSATLWLCRMRCQAAHSGALSYLFAVCNRNIEKENPMGR